VPDYSAIMDCRIGDGWLMQASCDALVGTVKAVFLIKAR